MFVIQSVVNMHRADDPMSEVISQATYATPVNVLEEKDQWLRVESPDSYQGWIQKKYTYSVDGDYPSAKTIARVRGLWAHIFYVKDITPHPPVITLPYGTKIEVVSSPEEFENRWIQVRLLGGREYWAQANNFDLSGRPLTLDEMLEESRQFLGLPYLWGGKSSFGYDCSGFVQTLFLQMGIELPRDAYLQADDSRMEDIAKSGLKKGDLLFFGPKEHVTHVGLYLGEDEFIHSLEINMIQISRLSDPEWQSRFAFAKRYCTR